VSTTIEWTDETWNPITGCTKVSQGCKNCYAEGIANRFFAKQYPPNQDGTQRKFTDVRCHPERLDQPLRWKEPRRVFVNSMSDLFHEDVPEEFIRAVFTVMRNAQRHTFQILTKRAARMLEIVGTWQRNGLLLREGHGCILPNVWLGVSVEDQEHADERIPLLLQTPAAVRFLSIEPQLGPVDMTDLPVPRDYENLSDAIIQPYRFNALTSADDEHVYNVHQKIDWVIVGGESGPGARPFQVEWAKSIVDQCRAAGVACFVKQLGSHVIQDGEHRKKRDRKGGDMHEWPHELRVREFPERRLSA
jgi:protein gp37